MDAGSPFRTIPCHHRIPASERRPVLSERHPCLQPAGSARVMRGRHCLLASATGEGKPYKGVGP
ncbi:hypothetical protein D779_0914 [Imhoffiella purpurea]|uniref:Uncharacterized protein n=1 Tax=Imhoffiella purpurea TaxID=1249627 RepID=W9VM33_9GAMM|nr:hypothetical protein D779_0914 [Imhoffiella purpurea]